MFRDLLNAFSGHTTSERTFTFRGETLFLLAPALLSAIWHLNNHAWPMDDAADYVRTAYQQYLVFRDHGWSAGLIALHDLRGWRPTLMPVLLTPALILFNGNVLAATGTVLTLIQLALTLYTFKLLRIYLPTRSAIIGAVTIVTLPGIAAYSLLLFSELPWLLAVVAFIYHLISSRDFSLHRHSLFAGLFLGVALTIRPALTTIQAFLPLLYVAFTAYRSKSLTPWNIVHVLLILSAVMLYLGLSAVNHWGNYKILWLVGLGAVGLWAGWHLVRRRMPIPATLFAVGVSFVVMFWWAGFVDKFLEWAVLAGIGDMATKTDNYITSMTSLLNRSLGIYLSFAVKVLAGLAIFAFVETYLQKRKWTNTPEKIGHLGVIGVGFLLAAVSYLLYSGTSDSRRAMVGIYIIVAFLVVIALQRGPLRAARAALVSLLFLGAAASTLNAAHVFKQQWALFKSHQPYAHLEMDFNRPLISRLADLGVKKHEVTAVYTTALADAGARIYEPAALSVAALTLGREGTITYIWDQEDPQIVLSQLRDRQVRYLLLDTNPMVPNPASAPPSVRFAGNLLEMLGNDHPLPPGLVKLASFPLGGRDHILFRILPQRDKRFAGAKDGTAAITSSSAGDPYPPEALIDGTMAPWGSSEAPSDVLAGVGLAKPQIVKGLKLWLFTPGGRAHLKDIRIVYADQPSAKPDDWQTVSARLAGQEQYVEMIEVPASSDQQSVEIEIDPSMVGQHKFWGIACKRSLGDECNYIAEGNGMYLREIELIFAD